MKGFIEVVDGSDTTRAVNIAHIVYFYAHDETQTMVILNTEMENYFFAQVSYDKMVSLVTAAAG